MCLSQPGRGARLYDGSLFGRTCPAGSWGSTSAAFAVEKHAWHNVTAANAFMFLLFARRAFVFLLLACHAAALVLLRLASLLTATVAVRLVVPWRLLPAHLLRDPMVVICLVTGLVTGGPPLLGFLYLGRGGEGGCGGHLFLLEVDGSATANTATVVGTLSQPAQWHGLFPQ